MSKKKVLYFENLKRFWNKTEAWIETNIQALFDNDEELNTAIDELKKEVLEINNTIIAGDAEDIAEDEYTDDDILSVITPEVDDDEDTDFLGESND